MIVLSGDIGGTTTRLQFTDFTDAGAMKIIKLIHYSNSDYDSFADVIDAFFTHADVDRAAIEGACFDVAGPIIEGTVRCTNLPWVIKTTDLKNKLNLDKVGLINDFTAIGCGLDILQEKDLHVLQAGKSSKDGVKAYLGAGTGLGVGFVTYNQGIPTVHPTEGGHVDFAPVDDVQIELLKFLRQKYHRVSFERLVSGPGIVNIYRFVRSLKEFSNKENPALSLLVDGKGQGDIAAAISEYATKYADPLACETLNIFVRIYGAVTGNLALTTLPFGGLYIVGGIAPKLISLINSSLFLDAFADKGRMSNLIKDIPMQVVMYTDVGLQGSALYARNIARGTVK